MSGLDQSLIAAIIRLKFEFICNVGNPVKTTYGTGFFLKDRKDNICLITNKHNIDAKLKCGPNTTYILHNISLLMRKELSEGRLSIETKWIVLASQDIKSHQQADVAAIKNIKFEKDNPHEYSVAHGIQLEDLAGDDYIRNKMAMFDVASFVGFAGSSEDSWWDTEGQLPIARIVNIASYTKKDFKNPRIKTENVMLVSGLSFSGASGSPIFLHEKGTPNLAIGNHVHVPPKIIGIMSGHFNEELQSNDLNNKKFTHAGLSYFTLSTAILDLI